MTLGMCYGLVSGYFGGAVDSVMQRFAEINNGIPRLVICTLLLMVLKPGFGTIVLTLVITEWIGMSRIARAEMLKLKEQEFVLANRTLGAGSIRIIFSAVLPNIIGQIITQLMFSIPTPSPNPRVEKTRVAESYDYASSGLDYHAGTLHTLEGTHQVLGTDEEIARWTAK